MNLITIGNIFSAIGAVLCSQKKVKANLFYVNLFYSIGNIIGIVYFIATWQPDFIWLYCLYLVIAMRGIYENKGDRHDLFHRHNH